MRYTNELLARYEIIVKEIRDAFPSMSHEWASGIAYNIVQALEGK